MIRFFSAVVLICSISFPVRAQEAPSVTPELDPEICSFMVAHQPDSDVAYTPGVDVHGKPVIEADVGGGAFFIQADEISFTLNVDLAKYLGIGVPEGIETKADLGMIVIDRNGAVTFNGQPMEGGSEAALRSLCAKTPEINYEDNKQ